eukprot:TRINITY_DN1063_c0_g1_i2.p1 TRINITY_DN1063_c0_g1~~TRINITY_DN1063_c0_g1_i2.p1  ORF type:complete len:267 (-),score=64.54 TRINITY_DN1063_c0_g1_i2:258-1058(-)
MVARRIGRTAAYQTHSSITSTKIDSDDQWQAVTQREGLVVIDVHSTWCGPCTSIGPTLKRFEFEHPDRLVSFASVDPSLIEVLQGYNTTSAESTFLLYKDGKQVRKLEHMNVPELLDIMAEHAPPRSDYVTETTEEEATGAVDDAGDVDGATGGAVSGDGVVGTEGTGGAPGEGGDGATGSSDNGDDDDDDDEEESDDEGPTHDQGLAPLDMGEDEGLGSSQHDEHDNETIGLDAAGAGAAGAESGEGAGDAQSSAPAGEEDKQSS